MSKYNKEYVEKLYKEENHKEVSRLVKERLITNEDRDEWLLNLASQYNHNNLAKALIQIPSVKVNDAFDWAVYNNNEELTYNLLKNREGEIDLDIQKHFIDSIHTLEFDTFKGAILAKPDLVSKVDIEHIFEIIKNDREDVATVVFDNANDEDFNRIMGSFEFYPTDLKIDNKVCKALEALENVSWVKIRDTYNFNYAQAGQTAVLSMIDKFDIPEIDKGKVFRSLSVKDGFTNYWGEKENLIAERIKDDIKNGVEFKDTCLIDIATSNYRVESRAKGVKGTLCEFIFNNTDLKKEFKKEIPEIYNELNKQRVKDNVMSF